MIVDHIFCTTIIRGIVDEITKMLGYQASDIKPDDLSFTISEQARGAVVQCVAAEEAVAAISIRNTSINNNSSSSSSISSSSSSSSSSSAQQQPNWESAFQLIIDS